MVKRIFARKMTVPIMEKIATLEANRDETQQRFEGSSRRLRVIIS